MSFMPCRRRSSIDLMSLLKRPMANSLENGAPVRQPKAANPSALAAASASVARLEQERRQITDGSADTLGPRMLSKTEFLAHCCRGIPDAFYSPTQRILSDPEMPRPVLYFARPIEREIG